MLEILLFITIFAVCACVALMLILYPIANIFDQLRKHKENPTKNKGPTPEQMDRILTIRREFNELFGKPGKRRDKDLH